MVYRVHELVPVTIIIRPTIDDGRVTGQEDS